MITRTEAAHEPAEWLCAHHKSTNDGATRAGNDGVFIRITMVLQCSRGMQ